MNRDLKIIRREWPALLVLMLGAWLRFRQLGDFPFHPDEAIHAWFALGLRDYHYDPVYHGPLLYHLTAAAMAVLGAGDFSARVVPAALGVLLLWLVLFPTRKYIGERAALWSGVLLALSPVVVAYSRRLLHDSLVLVLTLGALLCFQAALDNASTTRAGRNARLALAAILSLFLATKANVFFIAAMLAAFWFWHRWAQRKSQTRCGFDFQTPLLCAMVAITIFAILFRTDSLRALPAMLEYWGGQQREPRLPGPHDYYFRLLLLYELPLFVAALWGAFCALRRSPPFSHLLLWWTFSSLALYAIANEKVPWLMAHQVLPLALLGGFGLAQIEIKSFARRAALGAVALLGMAFSVRHVVATNFENAADRHEPLLFAQTTEAYRDSLFEALKSTQAAAPRAVWIAPGEQWPAAWYLRNSVSALGGSVARWDELPPDESTLRVVFSSPQEWRKLQYDGRFVSWNYRIVERYVWPRPAWTALRPATFGRFWWQREASLENGVLAEQSSAHSAIGTLLIPNNGD